MTDNRRNARAMHAARLLCAAWLMAGTAQAQTVPGAPSSPAADLGLNAADANRLERAMADHDYPSAEQFLLGQIAAAGKTGRAARLLDYAGAVYYAAGDAFHAAVAWNKSQAIEPLPTELQFSLAMAYVRMGKREWARTQLEKLAAAQPNHALYPYWLGRLQFDALQYSAAIAYFQRTLRIDPSMARAYDNLGLCLFAENRVPEAIAAYRKAIALDGAGPHPSPWPHINLADALRLQAQDKEALSELQQALRIDPSIASAHFSLGSLLETQGDLHRALAEFAAAASLDPQYAEPHVAIARIDRKLGREADADAQVKIYVQLRNAGKNRGTGPASQQDIAR